jgi:hypothetical protein
MFRSNPRVGVLLSDSRLIATRVLHLVPQALLSGSAEILAGLTIAAGVLLVLE